MRSGTVRKIIEKLIKVYKKSIESECERKVKIIMETAFFAQNQGELKTAL